MAQYDVTVSALGSSPNILIWNGNGGTNSSNAFALAAGDTVRFKRSGTYSGTVSVTGFASGMWTSVSTLFLTTSYQTKTVKTGGTAFFQDSITATAGSKTQTRWFELAGVDPDTSITDIDTITRPNGSTNHSITIANGETSHSNTIFEVKENPYSSVLGSRTGNGSITVSSIPDAGTYATYYVMARVPTANGGDNSSVQADNYIVVHESASGGGSSGDGGTGTHGLRVFDSSGNITLDLSDRVVTFRERVTGTMTSSEATKTVTLSGTGTAVINLTPITNIFVNNIPQRQQILYFTISGTTLTINRTATFAAGSSPAALDYDLLVVYDPEA